MIFIDDYTPKGAKTLHKSLDNIRDEWKDNYKKYNAKREFFSLDEMFISIIIQIM